MPPAEQLDQDLWSLPVPIPDNPLRYVSVYAFGTGEGLVLIDAGWGAEESWRALRAGLNRIGAGVADVRGVLVTHMHFDHRLGRAGPAGLGRVDRDAPRRPGSSPAPTPQRGAGGGRGGGVPARSGRVACASEPRVAPTRPDGRTTTRAGQLLHGRGAGRRAGWKLRRRAEVARAAVSSSTAGRRSARSRAARRRLRQRGAAPDPLGDYLDSAGPRADLDVDEVLPAHQWRFRYCPAGRDAIAATDERRLANCWPRSASGLGPHLAAGRSDRPGAHGTSSSVQDADAPRHARPPAHGTHHGWSGPTAW